MPPHSSSIRVAVVEDNAAERRELVGLLRRSQGIECTGAYGTAREALELLPRFPPDVVLMDINLSAASGVDCVRKLRPLLGHTQFMMLTVVEDHEKIFDSLRSGATGYLLKSTTSAKLLDAIQELHQGGAPMSGQIAREVIRHLQAKPAAPGAAKLTPLERRVLELLAQGLIYKEVAERLDISLSTVRTHIWHIYQKLEVHNRTEAIRKGLPR